MICVCAPLSSTGGILRSKIANMTRSLQPRIVVSCQEEAGIIGDEYQGWTFVAMYVSYKVKQNWLTLGIKERLGVLLHHVLRLVWWGRKSLGQQTRLWCATMNQWIICIKSKHCHVSRIANTSKKIVEHEYQGVIQIKRSEYQDRGVAYQGGVVAFIKDNLDIWWH